MMYQKLFFTFLFLCVSLLTMAQTSGRVIDSNNVPIDGASVVAQTTDSIFVAAAITDQDGYFTFSFTEGNYRLVFQHLLYKSVIKEISGSSIGVVVMEEQDYALNEVVVKAERPQVKVENGSLVYDMSFLAEKSVVNNAYESILYLPGVIEQSEGFALVGANSATVILNGKPTSMSREQLMNVLKNTPVANVEKAEVMYNAPAKYRVRGAVINIVLKNKKTDDPFLRGEVGAEYAQHHYGSGKGNVSLSYSNNKITADLLYSADYGKSKMGIDLFSNHNVGGKLYEVEQMNNGSSRALTHNGRLGLDYKINDKHNVSMAYTTAISNNNKGVQLSEGNISQSSNIRTGSEKMHNVNVDYTADFGLTGGFDFTFFNTPSVQDFTDQPSDGSLTNFRANAEQTINRWSIYAGQVHQLNNGWGINYGAEFSFVRDKNSQVYHGANGLDLSQSNTNSTLNEETYNLYGGFEKSFSDRLSLSFSVAGEYYKMMDYGKWSVYPTAQLSYTLSMDHIFQLGFSSDKTYPDYWSMQEQTSYMNGYAEIHGNPYLKPSKNYSAELLYVLKRKYMVQLYYEYNPDQFEQLAYQDPNRLSLIYQTVNYDYTQKIGLVCIVPFSIGDVLSSKLTLNGYYHKSVNDKYHEISFDRDKFTGVIVLNNALKISSKPNIMFELNGLYHSSLIQGIYDLNAVWKIDAGLKFGFANPNMELRIKGNDIFNSLTPDARIDYKGQNLTLNQRPDGRFVSVSFTYKFGGYKAKQHKTVDTSRFGVSQN